MNKKVNLTYSLCFFFLHAITCVVYGYGIYSLKARGYSAASAGECLAISSFVAFFLQAFLANHVDNSKKERVFEVSLICALVIFVFSIFNKLLNTKSIFLTIVFIIYVSIYIAIEPLINTLYTRFASKGICVTFSKARAYGSFSYAIFSLIFGTLTEGFGYDIVLYFFIAFAFCLLFDIHLLKNEYQAIPETLEYKEEKKENVSYLTFIKNNKLFFILIFFLAMVYFGYLIFDNFMLLVVEEIGGNSSNLGYVLGIKAIIETLGIFFVFPYFTKKMKTSNILIIAVIAFFLKALLSYLASSVYMLYAIQILQAFSFALITPGMVSFTSNTLNKNEITRGQALTTMAMVFGSFFASLSAGNIADLFGTKQMELVACVAAFVGMLGFIIIIKKVDKNEK